MQGLIQRVAGASVKIDGEVKGEIGRGILLLLGVEKGDSESIANKLLHKVLNYRIFPDEASHMNLSLLDVEGELLVISQFTLAADTRKGLRPSFSAAAPPALAEPLYDGFILKAREQLGAVESGSFGADMAVSLVNDGPVTFLLSAE